MTSAAADAQQDQVAQSFDQLQVVVRRDANVSVTPTNGQEIEGRLAELSPPSITLERMTLGYQTPADKLAEIVASIG